MRKIFILCLSFFCSCVHFVQGAQESLAQQQFSELAVNGFIEQLIEYLPHSSQQENADAIQRILEELRENGVYQAEGEDYVIRPGCVGLQCLVEETFFAYFGEYQKGDFEIHTTMPSTPCCKLPTQKAKETFLASFTDDSRLLTVDGRSISLEHLCSLPNAALHLTYTKKGLEKRSQEQRAVLEKYWASKVYRHCLDTVESFSQELNGATYRLLTHTGEEIFFSIQASQAALANTKCFTVYLGTKAQQVIDDRITFVEQELSCLGRELHTY